MRRAALVLVVTASLALAGCTAGDESDSEPVSTSAPEPVFDELAVPASMLADNAGAWGLTVLAPTGALPLLVAGILAEPGEVPHPAFWTSDGVSDAVPASIDVGVEGAARDVAVGASDQITALTGNVWQGGESTSFLLTSTDRAAWTPVEIPADVAPARLEIVAAIGATVYALGLDADDRAYGVAATGGDVRSFQLPDLPDGETRSLVGVAGHDDELVVLAFVGPSAQTHPVVAYRSSDAGATWSAAIELDGDDRSFAAGVVWTGSGYVATGGAPWVADAGADVQPTAWFSTDGSTWAQERVGTLAAVSYDGAAASLGVPSASGGVVSASLRLGSKIHVSVVQRRDSGWTYLTGNDLGWSTYVGGPTATAADGRVFLVADADGMAALYSMPASGVVNIGTLATGGDWYGVSDITAGPTGALLSVEQSFFERVGYNGWRTGSTSGLDLVSGNDVSESAWDPAELAARGSVETAQNEAGARIALASGWNEGATAVEVLGWFRAAADQEWQPVTGFEQGKSISVRSVVATSTGWVAVGTYGEDTHRGTRKLAAIWSSGDGITWTRVVDDLAVGALDSSAESVCTLPGGESLVVGHMETTDITNQYQVKAWRSVAGTWSSISLPGADGSGWFDSCASSDDHVVIHGSLNGSSGTWRSSDNLEFEEIVTVPSGDSIGEISAVPGGFAAFGLVDRAERVGSVIWLSADGHEWQWVAVPADVPTSAGHVYADGADLLVSASTLSGEQIWRVRGVAAYLEADTAG